MVSFTPLVFSTSGGMSGATNVFQLNDWLDLAGFLEEEGGLLECYVIASLSLNFSLLRPAIACLRGAQSHHGCPASHYALDL